MIKKNHEKNISLFPQKYLAAQLFAAMIQHWNSENSAIAEINYILNYIKIENSYYKL